MLKLLKYLKPYLWQVFVLLASIAIQVWGGLQLPALMATIVNQGIATADSAFIWQTGFFMVLWMLASALGALVSSFFSARLASALGRDLRNDVYRKVLSFSISEIDKFSTASLITRTTNDIAQVQQTMVMCLSMLVRAPLMAIGAIFQAFATAPDMTWIIALAVVVLLTFTISILAVVIPQFNIYQRLVDKITLLTRENLTGLRVVRAFNTEKAQAKKFAQTNTKFTKTDTFIGRVMSLQSPLMTLVFNGTSLLCIWIGINLMESDISYLGNMMAFMQYAIQTVMSFLFLAILFAMLPRANVSARRINEVLGTRPKIHWPKATSGVPSNTPSVEFKKVSFAYDGAEEKILKDISFKATAGQTTAFIGSTGSGKSTLINLVPRFYDATSGEILINGLPAKDYAEDDLMKRIGYVPQRGFLFSGDIKSNIAFGAPAAKLSQLEQAAEIAQAKEFITKLEQGFASHIAEGGTNVSGGQKQRLSIARAVAKNPEIYIFDDSFSALDMKTDAKLRAALKPVTKDAVTLIVAQRVSTIKDAEQIVVLDRGKVVGRGTHYQLLKNCKIYREIAKSQISDQEFEEEMNHAQAK
jgi:ATP-binding cassette subfamily B protein